MQQTTITCDRCGTSWEKGAANARQLWNIGIHLGCPCLTSIGRRGDLTAEWCRECVVKAGLIGQSSADDKQTVLEDPPPTLEDLIREIVRDEAEL